MKKRVLSIILCVCYLFTLVGCAKKQDTGSVNNDAAVNGQEEAKLQIVTTSFPPYDFVRQIAGDKVEVTMLLAPGAESHSFEPTPSDMIKIKNCDLFIYGGGESEDWVKELASSLEKEESQMLSMMEVVDLLKEETVEGMQEDDHDHGTDDHDEEDNHDEEDDHDHETEYDEHVWTSPKNVMAISTKITEVLGQLDSENKDVYEANLASYLTELETIDEALREVVANGNRTTFVFGDRFPFRYFAAEYGLDYYAAFPGCSTETEPSAATIAFLINKVKETQIPVVFYTEFSNQKIADTVCEATGAKKMIFYATHNISKDDFQAGKTYVDFMKLNIENLKEALQ